MADHYRNMEELLEHIKAEPIPKMDQQNLLLSRFCYNAMKDKHGYTVDKLVYRDYKEPKKQLDFENFPKAIHTLIKTKSFFKRFNNLVSNEDKAQFEQILARADIELFHKDQPVFMDGRVGVVSMGSIEVRSHYIHDLMKPTVANKAIEGEILGFDGDSANITTFSPLTWFVSMQDQTEIVFI